VPVPTHAKVLSVLLALNVGLNVLPLLGPHTGQQYVTIAIAVLLLVGFLKGSEGARTLLLIGAGINVIFGAFGLIAALPAMSASGTAGLILVASGAYSLAVGLYMMWALRNQEVMQWMLNRSLGGALDDDV